MFLLLMYNGNCLLMYVTNDSIFYLLMHRHDKMPILYIECCYYGIHKYTSMFKHVGGTCNQNNQFI